MCAIYNHSPDLRGDLVGSIPIRILGGSNVVVLVNHEESCALDVCYRETERTDHLACSITTDIAT